VGVVMGGFLSNLAHYIFGIAVYAFLDNKKENAFIFFICFGLFLLLTFTSKWLFNYPEKKKDVKQPFKFYITHFIFFNFCFSSLIFGNIMIYHFMLADIFGYFLFNFTFFCLMLEWHLKQLAKR
jgi:quinol-cytochrome oxidoreductase complex cytochrome b subunit